MKWASAGCAILVTLFLVALGADLLWHGVPGFTDDTPTGAPLWDLATVTLTTLATVALAILFATPVSLAAAVLCVEVLLGRPGLARVVRRTFDVMVSIPSVAVGLVGWSLFCTMFGLGFSILAGALTLALMLVPVMSAAFINGFDAVPRALRHESEALGISRWDTLWRLVVPAARPALLAGLMLAIGRAFAETAALVLTSGISVRMPASLTDPGATLAVHLYHMARNVPGGEPRAYAAALLLMGVNVLVFGALSRLRRVA